jgi:hypothetical protein
VDNFFGGGSFSGDNLTFSGGAMGGLRQDILGQLMGSFNAGQQDLSQLGQAGAASMAALGPMQFGQADPQTMQNLFRTANQQFGTLGQTAQQLGAGQLDIMRQISAPKEQQARVGQQSNLFAQGRLGSTGGAGEMQALAEAQSDADLKRQLAANQFGMDVRQQALGTLGTTLGQAEGLMQGQFGRDLGRNQLAGQRALDRFGIAGSIFDSARASRMDPFQQLQAGLGSLSGIQGMQNAGFQQALQAAMARSNSQLGAAGIHQQNAAMTPNVGMDLLSGAMGAAGAAGGFGNLFSDVTLKEDIRFVNEDDGGNRWYTWDWNVEAKELGIDQPTYGVLAQEVRVYNPEAVTVGPQGYLMVNYGAL